MKIFVIMPFHTPFDFVYSDLIKEICERHGFEVIRADDMYSTKQILEDIVKGINSADLIIADLTENNPNVFYELGIAHGLNKPVQIITQSITELPFDISAYRVFTYSMIANKYSEAKVNFNNLIGNLVNHKTTLYGNPISDFLGKETPTIRMEDQLIKGSEGMDSKIIVQPQVEKGFFDHLSEFQDTTKEIYKKLEQISKATERIGTHFKEQTIKITQINQNQSQPDKISLARRLLLQSANNLGDYASEVEGFNEFFDIKIPQLRDNVEAVINYQKNQEISDEDRGEYKNTLLTAIETTNEAIEKTNNFAEVLNNFPNLQGNFTRQSKRAALALDTLTNNFSQIKALYDRLNEIE